MRWTVFSLVVLLGSLEAQAVAQPEVTPAVQRVALEVQEAAIKLQPLYRDCTTNPQKLHLAEGLRDLAWGITEASEEYAVNPFLALAVARRESSLFPAVGNGSKLGGGRDAGYFQIRLNGSAQQVCGVCDDVFEARCNARIALCFMAHLRDRVGENPWIYLGAYGRGYAPGSLAEARGWGELRLARRFLCQVRDDCGTIWPE